MKFCYLSFGLWPWPGARPTLATTSGTVRSTPWSRSAPTSRSGPVEKKKKYVY